MFVKSIASLARFAPGKMGKTTVAEGEFLFAGLNAFEPGQEHAPHAHEGQDSCTSSWKASAWFKWATRKSACPPVTGPWHLPACCIRSAIPARSGSWSWPFSPRRHASSPKT